ncbi:MAG: DUF1552 domain-containing protein, partial [Myxococcales bacterium]|nr:DUF1552 domain-containing protein [Myxococcales bacterium]
MPRKLLSRRTVLRGVAGGATIGLALPPLDAMFGNNDARADAGADGPIFGLFYWANGTPWHAGHGELQGSSGYPDLWTPATTGPGYAQSELLAHLAAHQPTVATGLTPHTDVPPSPPGQEDGHMRGFMVALTGDRIRPEGFDHPSHTLTALRPSLDQYVAKHEQFYGSALPRFRSLVLGASPARFHDYGHWNAISYNGPDSLNQPILDPGQLYDLLFAVPADLPAVARRAALIDAVMADANDLKQKLGPVDRVRVDEHLMHLDEIQRRLELTSMPCMGPTPQADTPDLLAKTQIMGSLLGVALGCGLSRVFSFMLTSPASTHVFSNLGVPNDMHSTCHAGEWQMVRDITNYHMQAFGLFLDQLAAVVDLDGASLLDRAVIFGTSEYGEGWQHSVAEMPAVIVGGGCGAIQRGVHV